MTRDNGTMRYIRADLYDALTAEVEALRKDAERYRWLRIHSFVDAATKMVISNPLATQHSPEMVDSIIDAAIAEREQT